MLDNEIPYFTTDFVKRPDTTMASLTYIYRSVSPMPARKVWLTPHGNGLSLQLFTVHSLLTVYICSRSLTHN